ncbi:hypothetical protein [Streptomyces hoynatensis]|uniref:Uncharacterized protein n=1 Tax=Streptomyces hoynatensis TaxID=1141874 RepID=A0A3A9Z427_9ACTN|nr:hypothetical protein [Streptomyces hoynatensis]RKN43035.1 hypothetical protein D7294_11025 [Streptomyces hoynatensis]
MAKDEEFMAVINRILSAEHVSIHASADGWLALATAGTAERDRLAGVAGEAEAEPGVGLAELADRLRGTAGWAEGASALAHRIAGQLRLAGTASARATERALALLFAYEEAEVELRGDEAISPAMVSAALRGEEEQERLLAEARSLLDELSNEFAKVTGGEPPPSPERGVPVQADVTVRDVPRSDRRAEDPSAAQRPGSPAGPAAGDPNAERDGLIAGTPPPGIVQTLGGDQPSNLSVLGPDSGEFSGWVQSPNTGYLVDPATGREFDPASARWIDPVTGLPFGEATEYATRLSGLGTGPGAMATGVGLAPLGGGGAVGGGSGLAGLYGGVLPPSVAHPGPAQSQVLREAQRNLRQRAAVAGRFAMREAAQGGRPILPPPASTGAGGRSRGGGANEPGRAGRATDLTEDPEVWSARRTAARGVLGE